jgi:hypothetical protein
MIKKFTQSENLDKNTKSENVCVEGGRGSYGDKEHLESIKCYLKSREINVCNQ